MACINHNDITYKTLLGLSGLTQLELDAKVRKQLEDTGTYPFIEQVVSGNTIPALIKEYNLTKSGDYYIVKDKDLGDKTIASLNEIYRDLEISITPLFNGESRLDIKLRATINRDLEVADDYPGISIKPNTPIFPQPMVVVSNNYIYEHEGLYYISQYKIGTYDMLAELPRTKNLKAAYSKAIPSTTSPVMSRDTVRFISENINLINSGENALYHSDTELPNTIDYYSTFNYPKFEISNSINTAYEVTNDRISINPKYIDNAPKSLERVLLQAEGILNDSQIEESLNRLINPVKLDVLRVKNKGYLIRNSGKDSDINDYHAPVQSNTRINRLEAMLDRLSDLYGIKFNRVTNDDLEFGEFRKYVPDASRVNAFILNGEIYINVDNASEDAPIHELSHMLLGTLKSTDYQLYTTLVNSVESLDDYNSRLEEFKYRSRTDANEEIFVDMFAKQFTNNLELPIDSNTLNSAEYAIKRNIDSAIFPSESTTKVALKDISGKSFSEIMDMFGTSITGEDIANAFNGNDSGTNRKLANIKEDLLKQGLLKEYCE